MAAGGDGTQTWQTYNQFHACDDECAEAWSILKDAGLLDDLGNPTELLRETAHEIIRGDQLKNQAVKDAMLQRDQGSTLQQWWKMSSDLFTTAEGHPFELHFYRNVIDGAEILDLDFHVVFKTVF